MSFEQKCSFVIASGAILIGAGLVSGPLAVGWTFIGIGGFLALVTAIEILERFK